MDADDAMRSPGTPAADGGPDAVPDVNRPEWTGWSCPVCEAPIHHEFRAGRPKVYCTNACRQRAYRWRCVNRHRLRVPQPPERASTGRRLHAVRSADDFVSRRDRRRPGRPKQRITACGLFAIAAGDTPDRHSHTEFHAVADPDRPDEPVGHVCRSCWTLLDVPIESGDELLARVLLARLSDAQLKRIGFWSWPMHRYQQPAPAPAPARVAYRK